MLYSILSRRQSGSISLLGYGRFVDGYGLFTIYGTAIIPIVAQFFSVAHVPNLESQLFEHRVLIATECNKRSRYWAIG